MSSPKQRAHRNSLILSKAISVRLVFAFMCLEFQNAFEKCHGHLVEPTRAKADEVKDGQLLVGVIVAIRGEQSERKGLAIED